MYTTLRQRVVRVLFIFAAALVIGAPHLWGSGFSINELGVNATAMGTAFTAVADDGSALYYNPAGISFLDTSVIELDTLAVHGIFHFIPSSVPAGTVVPSGGYNGAVDPKIILVGNIYLTMPIKHSKWTVGFGSFTPFGLSDNWTSFSDSQPENTKFPARYAGSRGALQSIWFEPTVAYRLTTNSSIGVGGAVVHTHLFLESSFLNPLTDGLTFGQVLAPTVFPGVNPVQAAASIARLLPEGRERAAGTSNAPGFTGSYLYKHPAWKTNFGLMYRSAVVNHISGNIDFAFTQNYTLEQFIGKNTIPNLFPNQAIRGDFVEPATYATGVATTRYWNSTLSFDFRVQDYSRFKQVPLNFSINDVNDSSVALPPTKVLTFNFRNAYYYAAGFAKPINSKTTIRAGFQFDRTAVPDYSVGPLFPDTNRISITGGASRQMGNKEVSFFFDFTKFLHRTTNVAANDDQFTNGTYKNVALLAGIELRLNRGKRDTY